MTYAPHDLGLTRQRRTRSLAGRWAGAVVGAVVAVVGRASGRGARGPRGAAVGLLAGVALAAGAWVPSAGALTISGTTVKTLPETGGAVTADARTRSAIYYLDLHAARDRDERFSVWLEPGKFATRGVLDEGSALDGPMQFTLYGPGQVGQVVNDPAVGGFCSSRDRLFHGYATGRAQVDVWLPAGADTILAVRYELGRRAPWIDTDLRLRFGFASTLVGSYEPGSPLAAGPATPVDTAVSSGRTQPIPVKARGKSGKIGAHLTLSTTPRGTYGTDGGAPRGLGRSATVKVSGRLNPPLAGKRVQLQWGRETGPLRVAAVARTGRGGRFTATMPNPGRGTWELWARYPSQGGSLASDTTSCPLVYRVR